MTKKIIICGFCGAKNNIETDTYTIPENSDAFSIVTLQDQIKELKKGKNTTVPKKKKDKKHAPEPENKTKEKVVKNGEKKGTFGDWL